MASEILLVNPRRRRGRRTAAQKRATRKMIAANRRPRRARKRRRNPIGPYAKRAAPRRRRRPAALGYYVNPRRRRKRAAVRRTRRRNPARRGFNVQAMMNQLVIPAATAGGGAVLLDVLWGFIPVPEGIKTGPMRHVAKGIGAVVLGQLVGMMGTKRMGDTMALGALTVTFHAAFREMTAQFMPQIPLGYYSPGAVAGHDPQLGYYVSSPRLATRGGESVASPNSELGYYVQEGAGAQY